MVVRNAGLRTGGCDRITKRKTDSQKCRQMVSSQAVFSDIVSRIGCASVFYRYDGAAVGCLSLLIRSTLSDRRALVAFLDRLGQLMHRHGIVGAVVVSGQYVKILVSQPILGVFMTAEPQ